MVAWRSHIRAAMLGMVASCSAGPAAKPSAPPYAGPIIDCHAHLVFGEGASELNPDLPATAEVLTREMRRAGVTQAGIITMAQRGEPDRMRADNDAILAAAAASKGRLFAIGSVHPDDGDVALAEIDRLAAAGARAIKLHPNTQKFATGSPAVHAVVARAGKAGLVVLFDGYSPFEPAQLGAFLELAIANPDARLVIAHMGGPRFTELAFLIDVLDRYPWYRRNIWIDLSAVATFYASSPHAPDLAWAIRKVDIDRVLFGSDFPLFTPADAVAAVRALGFTAAEQRAVFHDNAAALFRLARR